MTLSIKYNQVSTSMVSKCPVCGGKGRVPYGFYAMGTYISSNSLSVNLGGEICRSCHGKGIIIH